MRTGRHAAKSVLATIEGKKAKPFDFAGMGDACSLGQRRAVSHAWGFRMYGIPAWIAWRAMFVTFVPTWDRRVRLVLDWFLTPLLGRDIVNIQMDEPYGVRQELYEPGQEVVRQGEIGKRLYVILKGDAEVVRSGPNGEESLAVLVAGSHFGETAVFENVRRNATVRAKTRLQVISIGQDEAVTLSSAVRPFGEAMRRVPQSADKTTN
jgi:NADH dehydrogenase